MLGPILESRNDAYTLVRGKGDRKLNKMCLHITYVHIHILIYTHIYI